MAPIYDTERQASTITTICAMDGGAWHLEAFTDNDTGRAFIDLQTPETLSVTTAVALRADLDAAIRRATHASADTDANYGRVIASLMRAAHVTTAQVAPVLGLEDEDLQLMLDGHASISRDEADRICSLLDILIP